MLNFTVGPVMSNEEVRKIGSEQVPYFRTPEFSQIMFENERYILNFANAPQNSRAVFITGSGTASMEAVVMNMLSDKDKALVINGGSFGQRFSDLLDIYDVPFDEIKLDVGKILTKQMLEQFNGKGYTAFLVNIHETSTGVYYDRQIIAEFCKNNNLFLIVDAISSFLADEFDMSEIGADVMITGSQKALACPPGISVIVLSDRAVNRALNSKVKCMYLNLKDALENAERGQTPFTPAVSILRQINARLKQIDANGGAKNEIAKTASIADDFRKKIVNLPFEIVSHSLSNAVTPLHPLNVSAYGVFNTLKDEYDIWVCPNGGNLKEYMFRVGHIGCLTYADNDALISAFCDMQKRGLL